MFRFDWGFFKTWVLAWIVVALFFIALSWYLALKPQVVKTIQIREKDTIPFTERDANKARRELKKEKLEYWDLMYEVDDD